MDKLIRFVDMFVSKFWMIFSCIVFGGALLIKAMYNMEDYPYFSLNTAIDIFLLIIMIIGYWCLFKYSDIIEKNISYPFLIIAFALITILFIVNIPIRPFSDMQHVTQGALLFAKRDIDGILSSGYLQYINKNLKVAMFYGVLDMLFPKNVIFLRIINIVLYLMIAYFSGKIAKNLGINYPKVVFILVASFMPLILYCNHIYFDLPTFFLCLLAIYFYTKDKSNWKNILLAAVFLGLGCCMRVLALLFFIAIFVDYIFTFKRELFTKFCRKLVIIVVFAVVTTSIPKLCDTIVNKYFRVENVSDESIWTLFWMGINEEEFGMMHNEIFDGERTFDDFITLLLSRNVEQNIKLFGRKIFWTWSQGTWQAQRYGFGGDAVNVLDKFEYETPFTRFFLNNEQIAPKLANSIMRAQYMAFFFFMILGLFNMDEEDIRKYRIFIYLCFGTFLILVFYEMKSRYVLHCLISMIVLGFRGMENIMLKRECNVNKEQVNIS